jgi:hypothetical protein
VIRSEQKASVSLLQRRLRLGYGRAARIMDELENRGIVGPSKGAEPRDILIDLDGGGADGRPPVESGDYPSPSYLGGFAPRPNQRFDLGHPLSASGSAPSWCLACSAGLRGARAPQQ